MIIQNIFTNFLALEKTNLDNKKLQEFCYSSVKNKNYKVNSEFVDLNNPAVYDLKCVIEEKAKELHSHFNFSENMHQEIYDMWININDSPYITVPHEHVVKERILFSGVYYVKAEKQSAIIEFLTPIAAHRHVISPKILSGVNPFTAATWNFKPSTGDLIFFPSWLLHYVVNSFNGEDRISLAFNTYIRNKG